MTGPEEPAAEATAAAPAPAATSELHERARAHGVATSYVDGTGVERVPSDATLSAILDALDGSNALDSSTVEAPQPGDRAPERCAHGPQPTGHGGVRAARRTSPDQRTWTVPVISPAWPSSQVEAAGGSVGDLPWRPGPTRPARTAADTTVLDERWVDPEWVATRLPRADAVRWSSDLADHEAAWTSTCALAEVLGGFDGLLRTATWRSHHPEVEQWARWKAAALVAGWDPTVWTDELDHAVRSSDDAVLASLGVSSAMVDFEVFSQWAVTAQLTQLGSDLRARSMSLYLDLPVGTNAAGYDAWVAPDAFGARMSIGAPPDLFFPDGQSWGLRPPLPGTEAGLADLRHSLETHMAVCGLLRIDHVMGLDRLFWVPEGGEAGEGTYVTYDAGERWRLVSELSQHFGCGVVGEDLGTVPSRRATRWTPWGLGACSSGRTRCDHPSGSGGPFPPRPSPPSTPTTSRRWRRGIPSGSGPEPTGPHPTRPPSATTCSASWP